MPQKTDSAPAGRASERISVQFWKDRQLEFEKLTKESPDLEANLNGAPGRWWLDRAGGKEAFEDSALKFRAVASKAAAGLSDVVPGVESWESWLSAMRNRCSDGKTRRWGYESYSGGTVLKEGPHPLEMELAKFHAEHNPSADLTDCDRVRKQELEKAASNEWEYFESGTIMRVLQSSAYFCEELALLAAGSESEAVSRAPGSELATTSSGTPGKLIPIETKSERRRGFADPLLDRKGWSIGDWATEARVDYNTVDDYLKGITNPRKSTRDKLATALKIEPPAKLPD